MKLIVDANVVIAALIRNNITRKLLFNKKLLCFSPSFLLQELNKHNKIIQEKADLNKKELNKLKIKLLKKIYLIKEEAETLLRN